MVWLWFYLWDVLVFIGFIIWVPFLDSPKSPLCPTPTRGTLVWLFLCAAVQTFGLFWLWTRKTKTPCGQQGLEGKTVKPLHGVFCFLVTLSSNFFLFSPCARHLIFIHRGEKRVNCLTGRGYRVSRGRDSPEENTLILFSCLDVNT